MALTAADKALIATPATLREGNGKSADYEAQRTIELVTALREDFHVRDNYYEQIERTIFGRTRVDIPKAYKKTATVRRSPLAVHFTNTVVAALAVNPYTVQFPAETIGKGMSAQANASQREHFFEASWHAQEQQAKRRLFRLFMWSLVTKGEGILKTMQRTNRAWGDYNVRSDKLLKDLGYLDGKPSSEYRGMDADHKDRIYSQQTDEWKKVSPYPIFTTDVPPESFYYLKGEDGFSYCCEVKDVPYYTTLASYGMGLDGNGKVQSQALGLARPQEQWSSIMSHHSNGRTKSVSMIEAWDWQYVTYILQGPGDDFAKGGQVVKRIKHGYGNPWTKTLRGPYFHAQGITTASRLPEYAGLSILFGFLDLFAELDQLLTIQHNSAVFTGFPTFKRNKPAGSDLPPASYGDDDTGDDDKGEIEPGQIFPHDISPMEQPKASDALKDAIGLVRAFLDLCVPSIVQGVASGDESGYAFNQAAHLARLAWDPIVDNSEIALGDRVGFESWLIENRIGEKVWVYQDAASGRIVKRGRSRVFQRGKPSGWLSMDPDSLKGVHLYRAHLDPDTPANRVIEVREHEALLKLRLETPDQAIEAIGNNPDEVEEGWLEYELRQDPLIRQKLREAVFKKLGTIDQEAMTGTGGQLTVSPPMQPPAGVPSGVQNPPALQGFQPAGPPAGPPPGPTNSATAALGPVGQVFQPGHGMPMQPTPQGARTGFGPAGRALVRQGPPPVRPSPQLGQLPPPLTARGLGANPPGMPAGTPNPRGFPLPGE